MNVSFRIRLQAKAFAGVLKYVSCPWCNWRDDFRMVGFLVIVIVIVIVIVVFWRNIHRTHLQWLSLEWERRRALHTQGTPTPCHHHHGQLMLWNKFSEHIQGSFSQRVMFWWLNCPTIFLSEANKRAEVIQWITWQSSPFSLFIHSLIIPTYCSPMNGLWLNPIKLSGLSFLHAGT